MIGIYKYTNNINGKVYIGQSINLEQRKYAHKSSAFNEKANDYDSQFHQAKANSSKIAANKRKFSDEEIKNMRYNYDNGMSPKEVWQKYSPNSAWSTIYNIITRQTYKEIE